MDGWMDGWMDERINGLRDRRKGGSKEGRKEGGKEPMEGGMEQGKMDRLMDGWMDGWIDRVDCVNANSAQPLRIQLGANENIQTNSPVSIVIRVYCQYKPVCQKFLNGISGTFRPLCGVLSSGKVSAHDVTTGAGTVLVVTKPHAEKNKREEKNI